MKATGIVRRIDDLGRVVIPKEIRRTMRIREGDPSCNLLLLLVNLFYTLMSMGMKTCIDYFNFPVLEKSTILVKNKSFQTLLCA